MKSWLTKLRISSALDDCKTLPPAVARAINRSKEVRRFAEKTKALDQALKSQLPRSEAPVSLHPFIMGAVRAAVRRPAAENQSLWPRWIPGSGLAAVVALGIFLAFHFSNDSSPRVQPVDSSSFAAAGSALELGGSLMQSAPAAVLSPLSDEMQRLDHDLANTKEFLFASLP